MACFGTSPTGCHVEAFMWPSATLFFTETLSASPDAAQTHIFKTRQVEVTSGLLLGGERFLAQSRTTTSAFALNTAETKSEMVQKW